ncbi:hypothetical protein D3C84_352460 [compost metagenome]
MQHDALPTSGTIQCVDGGCTRQLCCLMQVVETLDGERNGAKAAVFGFLGDIHIGQRTSATQVKPSFGSVHDDQTEISQKAFDHREIGMTVDDVVDVFYLQHDSSSTAASRVLSLKTGRQQKSRRPGP